MRKPLLAALALLAACGKPAPGAPGATPQGAAEAGVAASMEDAAPPSLRPTKLERKATPRERRLADEKACEANDVARCRRAADRYRGYGHIAGCGVDRARPAPHRMVTADDASGDAKLYDRWIRRACDLGDPDACVEGKNNVSSSRVSEFTADTCLRSGLDDCPLYQWVAATRPGEAKAVEEARRQFMAAVYGGKLFRELYRREKTRGGDVLPPEIATIAERICRTTLECDDVFMMLDKDGYTPAALAPLRKTAGESLTTACLEGDCVCGEAARYLDATDPRLADLARMGCDDGEPDGCFVLGDLYDRGAGVEKSAATAFGLYDVACPSLVADDGREELYSKAACARLAERYEEGETLEKDVFRAFFYSTLACTRGGYERDHLPCLRRGRLHAQNQFKKYDDYMTTPLAAGLEFFFGASGEPVDAKECERPSVAALCKRDAVLIR
jgi:TPR repeat protein